MCLCLNSVINYTILIGVFRLFLVESTCSTQATTSRHHSVSHLIKVFSAIVPSWDKHHCLFMESETRSFIIFIEGRVMRANIC